MEPVNFVPGGWSSVAGWIVSIKYFDPAVHIILEQTRDDESSRVSLLADTRRLRGAIGKAFYSEGARTLEVGAYLTVTWTGYDGRAKEYEAAYERPKDEEAEARAMERMAEVMNRVWGSAAPDDDEGETSA
jgi:hypothetical protein